MDRMKALPAEHAEEHAGAGRSMHPDEARPLQDEQRPTVALYDPFSSLCTPQFSDHDFDHF